MKFKNSIAERLTGRHRRSFLFVDPALVEGKDIIDIGCSYGWFEEWAIRNRCGEIIGVDTNASDLSNARAEVPKADFLEASALNLPLSDKLFDIAVMWDVLEHLPRRTEEVALQEINRVLKDKGTLFLSTPHRTFWSCMLDPAWMLVGHRHYSVKNLSSITKQSGFELEKIEYGGGFWELLSMILLYLSKWVFGREVPFKGWFESRRYKEYMPDNNRSSTGFATVFVRARKVVKQEGEA